MIKKPITYTDYDGNERTENFYFNLSKAELFEMEAETTGGLEKLLERISNTNDTKKAMAFFKTFITRAYGEKSLDGKRFFKSKELSDSFIQTEAYSELLVELLTDSNASAEFLDGVIPANLRSSITNTPESNTTEIVNIKP